jgi:ketosteroid isomerase-like protein
MRFIFLTLAGLVACGPRPTPPAAPAQAAATVPVPERSVVQWIEGHWVHPEQPLSETWSRVGDVGIGVSFVAKGGTTGFFEVLVIHDVKGAPVYTAMPAGKSMVDFALESSGPDQAAFANPAHDDPKRLAYRRTGDQLHITIGGDSGEQRYFLQSRPGVAAPALEEADRAFAADSLARGGAAWAGVFAEGGVNWSVGAPRTVGGPTIAAGIDAMAAAGSTLAWEPVASGIAAAGDMGFTTGTYTVRSGREVTGTGVYVTVWRNVDGAWKIVFDSGVPT